MVVYVLETFYSFNTCIAPIVATIRRQIRRQGPWISCTGTSATDTTNTNNIFLYISENSICTGTLSTNPSCNGIFPNAFVPPTQTGDANHGFMLSNDIVISGATTGTLVFNTDNQIDTNGGVCDLEGFNVSYK